MGRRPKQKLLQRRHTGGQQTHEKMLNITNYQRNANKNCEYHFTPVRIPIIKKSTNNITLNGEQQRLPSKMKNKTGCALSLLLFNIALEVLGKAIREEKEIKGIQI